jgi:hypothetical protein
MGSICAQRERRELVTPVWGEDGSILDRIVDPYILTLHFAQLNSDRAARYIAKS